MEERNATFRTPMGDAVREWYGKGEEDETMHPLALWSADGKAVGKIKDGDYVIFYNLRGEREVELTESFTDPDFAHFETRGGLRANFATMILYHEKLEAHVAFPPIGEIHDTLSAVLSKNGLRQIKIGESEKAIHICFFLNGKIHEPMEGEDRIIIHSPRDVDHFDQKPEMSIAEVTDTICEKMRNPEYDVVIANFANTDVVGHTENREAIIEAVETVDSHIGRVVEEAKKTGRITIITADHGTVEKWLYPEGTIDTGHTTSPVPFIFFDPAVKDLSGVTVREDGELTDISPTILHALGIAVPEVMTGKNLLAGYPAPDPKEKKKFFMLVVDGWGVGVGDEGDLISQADTPVMDSLRRDCPSALLKASGDAVGLPEGTVGNSEAGHLHIGAGRKIYSDRVRVNKSIEDGSFCENPAFVWAMDGAKAGGKALHLLGIISFYSSHGSIDHLKALMKMAKERGMKEVYIHGLLGRRGERPEAGGRYIQDIEEEAARLGIGKVVSIIGRHWALDREENWDRIEVAYKLLVDGEGERVVE